MKIRILTLLAVGYLFLSPPVWAGWKIEQEASRKTNTDSAPIQSKITLYYTENRMRREDTVLGKEKRKTISLYQGGKHILVCPVPDLKQPGNCMRMSIEAAFGAAGLGAGNGVKSKYTQFSIKPSTTLPNSVAGKPCTPQKVDYTIEVEIPVMGKSISTYAGEKCFANFISIEKVFSELKSEAMKHESSAAAPEAVEGYRKMMSLGVELVNIGKTSTNAMGQEITQEENLKTVSIQEVATPESLFATPKGYKVQDIPMEMAIPQRSVAGKGSKNPAPQMNRQMNQQLNQMMKKMQQMQKLPGMGQ